MTAGERWTIGSCVGLAVVLLVFGMPENRSRAVRRSVAPAGAAVTSVPETTTTVPVGPGDGPASAPIPEESTTTTVAIAPPDATASETTSTTPPRRSTTTTTRPPPSTTTTAPCSLPAIAGQCLALPVPARG